MTFLRSNGLRFHLMVGAVVFFSLTLGLRPEALAFEGRLLRPLVRRGGRLGSIAKRLVWPNRSHSLAPKARKLLHVGKRGVLLVATLALVGAYAYGCAAPRGPSTVPRQHTIYLEALGTVERMKIVVNSKAGDARIDAVVSELKSSDWLKSRLNKPTDDQYVEIAKALVAGGHSAGGWNDPKNPYQMDAFGDELRRAAQALGVWQGADY